MAEVESSFNKFKRNSEIDKQGMEEKLQETLRELEALQFRKANVEAKVSSLEVALFAGIARNSEL